MSEFVLLQTFHSSINFDTDTDHDDRPFETSYAHLKFFKCKIDGTSASCSSSGGIFLKPVGRIGPSGQFGAAIWSESRGSTSVSISLSGCGEAIIRTHLAEIIASQLFNWQVIGFIQIK